MTVPAQTPYSGPYLADGVQTTFDRTFRVTTPEQLKIFIVTDGVEAAYAGDFSQTGIGADTGTVTLSTAPVSGSKVVLKRLSISDQPTDYATQGRVSPEVIEGDFDRHAMRDQEARVDLDRVPRMPLDFSGKAPVIPAPQDGKLLEGHGGNYRLGPSARVVIDSAAAASTSETNAATSASSAASSATSAAASADDAVAAAGILSRRYVAIDPAFGIVCDGDGSGGGTDNTTAIQNALNAMGQGERLIFTHDPATGLHHYNVTHVVWDEPTALYCAVEFDPGVRLFGVATTAKPGVLELRGKDKVELYNLTIATDGNRDAPLYAGNYACLLRLRPQLNGVDGYTADRPCQFINVVGGQLRNAKRGIIFGGTEAEAASGRTPFSEIVFQRMGFRGVEGPIVMNAENAYVEFAQCMIIGQKFEAGAWWSDSDGFLIKALTGSVIVNGGELQRAIGPGWGLYGKEITVAGGTVCEWAATSYATGRMEILQPSNCYFGPQSRDFLKVAPGALGRFIFNGQWEKNTKAAGGVSGLLIDATEAPNYDYTLDVDLVDFQFDSNDRLVAGGRPDIRRLNIRDDVTTGAVEWDFTPRANCWDRSIASPDGDAMSTTLDMTAKAGWAQTVGTATDGGFGKYTAAPPPGTATAIRFNQTAGQIFVSTPAGTAGLPLVDQQNVLSFYLKRLNASDFLGLRVDYYDFAGTLISSSSDLMALDAAAMTKLNLGAWQRLFVHINRPAGTRFVRVSLRGPSTGTTDMAISDLRLV